MKIEAHKKKLQDQKTGVFRNPKIAPGRDWGTGEWGEDQQLS